MIPLQAVPWRWYPGDPYVTILAEGMEAPRNAIIIGRNASLYIAITKRRIGGLLIAIIIGSCEDLYIAIVIARIGARNYNMRDWRLL